MTDQGDPGEWTTERLVGRLRFLLNQGRQNLLLTLVDSDLSALTEAVSRLGGEGELRMNVQDTIRGQGRRIRKLEAVFRHTFRRDPEDPEVETCAECGLNVRDAVHRRRRETL